MTTNKKYISVFIPTFNGEKYIAESIDMILKQKLPKSYGLELFVIDSGSRDKTVEIIKKNYLDKIKFMEIPNKDFGHGKTRQYAVDHTKGDFILFLTQDATPASENWLLNMIKPFELSPRVGCVFGRQIPRPDAVPTIKREVASVFANFGPGGVVSLNLDPNNTFFSDVNSAVSRAAIRKVPFRDLPYAEDQALARDMMAAGFVKAYAPDGTVNHSNEYTVREFFGRKFDEYLGLIKSVDYKSNGSFAKLLLGWVKPTLSDYRWIIHDRQYGKRRKIKYFALSIGYNFATRLGEYRAAKFHTNKNKIKQFSQEAKQKR